MLVVGRVHIINSEFTYLFLFSFYPPLYTVFFSLHLTKLVAINSDISHTICISYSLKSFFFFERTLQCENTKARYGFSRDCVWIISTV